MATASKEPPTEVRNNEVGTSETRATRKALPKDLASATSPAGSVRVEIFDQVYNLRGSDAAYIIKLAEYVDGKMRAVSEQTATVDSVRLAVLAALNIADEYHLLRRKLETPSPEAQQRASKLASALDEILEDNRRAG
ncbi:MAG: cell division protein ZapA [Terriglobales bacterium]